jgi:hypothetical protein
MTTEETLDVLALKKEIIELKGIVLGMQLRDIENKIKELKTESEKS